MNKRIIWAAIAVGLLMVGCRQRSARSEQAADSVSLVNADSAKGGKTEMESSEPKQTRIQGVLSDRTVGDDLTFEVGGVRFTLVAVEGGTFMMGTDPKYRTDYDDEEQHRVTVGSFYIGQTEVTQALWRAVMGSEPDYEGGWLKVYGRGDTYPAYRVGYDEVQEFLRRLNAVTGQQFRLPTEAEWEYAARGGAKSHGYRYSGSNRLADVAWCSVKPHRQTHPVAQRKPNELGLYDMSGNVFEWCSDWESPYEGDEVCPLGADTGRSRVMRGGCWLNESDRVDCAFCQVSNRESRFPNEPSFCVGFRIAL